jgi:hypothetical protein
MIFVATQNGRTKKFSPSSFGAVVVSWINKIKIMDKHCIYGFLDTKCCVFRSASSSWGRRTASTAARATPTAQNAGSGAHPGNSAQPWTGFW